MTTLYKSRRGDTGTQEYWLDWAKKFYLHMQMQYPKCMWERVVSTLKLRIVDEESQPWTKGRDVFYDR